MAADLQRLVIARPVAEFLLPVSAVRFEWTAVSYVTPSDDNEYHWTAVDVAVGDADVESDIIAVSDPDGQSMFFVHHQSGRIDASCLVYSQ